MPTLKLEGVDQILDRLRTTSATWSDLHVPFARSALVLYASTKNRFDVSGPGWPPLKVRKGQPLRDNGILMNSITIRGAPGSYYVETANSVEIGTNVRYANIHQFGFDGVEQVKAHSRLQTMAFGKKMQARNVDVKGHSRHMRIPARPFLLFSDQDRADIIRVFQDWLFKEK